MLFLDLYSYHGWGLARNRGKNKAAASEIKTWIYFYLFCWWNTPGTAGGPAGRDRMLAVKSRKTAWKIIFFFVKKSNLPPNFFCCIYLLVIPKYWGKNYFAHGSFPEVGQKQKTEKKKEERKKRRDWTMVKTMAKLRMAHASTHGARKPPRPKCPIVSEKSWYPIAF